MQKKEENKFDARDKHIRWFSELNKESVSIAGGKGANLGEMYNLKLPIPPGFVIIATAYKYFLEETKLDIEIYNILSKVDIEDTKQLDNASKKIQELIENAEIPNDLKKEILENYEALSFDNESLQKATPIAASILARSKDSIFVAVRSSATAEDSSAASFAGQQETFLNVKGNTDLIESVKKCFASLFTARSIYYRVKKGFRHENVLIAVVVQQMVNSDKSGVIFSRDPMNSSSEDIVIEAVYGLGEGIVSGRIKPDHYVVSRDLKIKQKSLADKKIALIRNSSGRTEIIKLTDERSKSQVMTDYEIKKYTDYAARLEKHYNSPQDIEFAIDSGNLYIVQTRPITTTSKQKQSHEEIEGKLIVYGQAASPGIGSGEVKIVNSSEDLEKIRKGNVLVTKMTNPDMVVAMQKSSAIVTDEGGMTAHAAIVSREMGIPCVVGTQNATERLKEGMFITVDGYTGKVYEGKLESLKAEKAKVEQIVHTKTKIKVIVDLPHFASRASETHAKEVGLTRIEGIIAESGKHPFYFKKGKIEEYEAIIYSGISKIAEHFEEIWIRTSDIRSDEYKNLEGAPSEIELNPMLGMHGIRQGLKDKEILKAELKAIKKLSETKKAGVMIPQVISLEELKETKKLLHEIGITKNLKIGVMIETPAAVQIIEELCQEGIDFISFGTNDLTQYTLAVDRGNEKVQYLYNEMHPAVLKQLASVIHTCKAYKVETSICGQAASEKKIVEFLVKHGIDSLSVNADKAKEISEFVKELEEKGLRGGDEKLGEEAEEIKHESTKHRISEEKKHEAIEKEKKEWQDVGFNIDIFKQHGAQGKSNEEIKEISQEMINNPEKQSQEHAGNSKKDAEKRQQEIMEKIKQALENAKNNEEKKHSENSSGLKVFDMANLQKSPGEAGEMQQQVQQKVAEAEAKIIEHQEKVIEQSIEISPAHEKDIHKAITEKSPMEQMLEQEIMKQAGKQKSKETKDKNGDEILDIF